MNHQPTAEQREIIEAYATGENLVIEAGAGTGKTSTLKMIAASNTSRRGVYVAYNRAIADDAKGSFPSNVFCATAHSLAFRSVGRRYADRLNGPRVPAREAARILLPRSRGEQLPNGKFLQPSQIARLAVETVADFCYSSAPSINQWHVPIKAGMNEPASIRFLRHLVVPLAERAWDDICSMNGRLKFTHDCYLKLWQLSDPRIDADFVLLDEAQDANPVIAEVVERQDHAQRILVGDRSQAIYGWRGAVDAMTEFGGRRLQLSQSFRFGQAIADEANKWLELLDAPLRLRGYEAIRSELVAQLVDADAVLCRTNAEAVAQIMDERKRGRRAALVGGGEAIRSLAEAAITLKAGLGTDHPELFAFQTWAELQDYVEQDQGGADLKVFVRLVDNHGAEVVIDTMDHLADESQADTIVSTAHKAKGREWPSVRIAPDFDSDAGVEEPVDPAEAMLAYVAVTRAQHLLDRGGLAWIDRALARPEQTELAI